MITLDEIKYPIREHLDNYEKTLSASVKSDVPLLEAILSYLQKEKGKQMRPMFVMFSAGLFGDINVSTYRAAAMVELLHTASLVHDDVVDDSSERRGKKSLNAVWQNKIAVLAGDFLVSKGMQLGIENKDYNILPIIVKAGYEMSEGELLQMEKALNLDITEDVYFQIIEKKTGALMSTCCASGAASAGASEEDINWMYDFGRKVGVAFQIRDDLLDFERHVNTGKPGGNDIREKKMTLPLIYMLNNISSFDRSHIIDIVKNHNLQPEKVAEVIEIVNKSDGIAYSKELLKKFQQEAIGMLDKYKDNKYSNYLRELVLFNTGRAH